MWIFKMNKTELSKQAAERLSISQKDMMQIINTLEELMAEAIKEEGSLLWKGFGTFNLWRQAARPGRNPKTGEPAMIPARNSLKFKPGRQLLLRLNEESEALHDEE